MMKLKHATAMCCGLILLPVLMLIAVGCKQQGVIEKVKGKDKIVNIDGYTYYKIPNGNGGTLAPTPETIKRCIREVNKEEFTP